MRVCRGGVNLQSTCVCSLQNVAAGCKQVVAHEKELHGPIRYVLQMLASKYVLIGGD